jgi:hypothetical protein
LISILRIFLSSSVESITFDSDEGLGR